MAVRMASKWNISSTCSVKSTQIRIDAKQQGLRHRIYHHLYHVKTYTHYAKFWSVQYPNQWAETLNPSTHQAHMTTVQLP
jgi:hypothetical protein